MRYILKKFLYKLFIALVVISMIGSYQLNAMKRMRELSPVPSEPRVTEQYPQDHNEEAFKVYMNLQLVENCPTLPLDVIRVISFDAYISSIISELSQNLTASRENSQEALTLIKSLQDRCGFNISIQALKMGLKQANMLLNDIKQKVGPFINLKLLDVMTDTDENNLDLIKIIFAAAGDQVQAMISATDGLFGMPPFYRVVCFGRITMVRAMLEAVGDGAQELINFKHIRYGNTALGAARVSRNDPQYFDIRDNIDEVISLLENYQPNNQ